MFEHIVNSVYIPSDDVISHGLDESGAPLSLQFYDINSADKGPSQETKAQWPGKAWHGIKATPSDEAGQQIPLTLASLLVTSALVAVEAALNKAWIYFCCRHKGFWSLIPWRIFRLCLFINPTTNAHTVMWFHTPVNKSLFFKEVTAGSTGRFQ